VNRQSPIVNRESAIGNLQGQHGRAKIKREAV